MSEESSRFLRERYFATRLLYENDGFRAGESEPLSECILLKCYMNDFYHSTVNSVAWEFDIPILITSIVGPFDGFPLSSVDGFREEVYRRCGIDKISKLGAEKLHASDREKAVDWCKKRKDFQEHKFRKILETMSIVEIFSCITNKALKQILRDALEFDDELFSEVDPIELAGDLLMDDDLFKQVRSSSLISADRQVEDFDNEAWHKFKFIVEPFRQLVVDAWDHHLYQIQEVMTELEFKKHRRRIDDFLTLWGLPEELERAYLKSFSRLRDRAFELSREVAEANRKVAEMDILSHAVSPNVADRVTFFQRVNWVLDTFVNRATDGLRSVICICDVSPTGFLNNPLPPL